MTDDRPVKQESVYNEEQAGTLRRRITDRSRTSMVESAQIDKYKSSTGQGSNREEYPEVFDYVPSDQDLSSPTRPQWSALSCHRISPKHTGATSMTYVTSKRETTHQRTKTKGKSESISETLTSNSSKSPTTRVRPHDDVEDLRYALFGYRKPKRATHRNVERQLHPPITIPQEEIVAMCEESSRLLKIAVRNRRRKLYEQNSRANVKLTSQQTTMMVEAPDQSTVMFEDESQRCDEDAGKVSRLSTSLDSKNCDTVSQDYKSGSSWFSFLASAHVKLESDLDSDRKFDGSKTWNRWDFTRMMGNDSLSAEHRKDETPTPIDLQRQSTEDKHSSLAKYDQGSLSDGSCPCQAPNSSDNVKQDSCVILIHETSEIGKLLASLQDLYR